MAIPLLKSKCWKENAIFCSLTKFSIFIYVKYMGLSEARYFTRLFTIKIRHSFTLVTKPFLSLWKKFFTQSANDEIDRRVPVSAERRCTGRQTCPTEREAHRIEYFGAGRLHKGKPEFSRSAASSLDLFLNNSYAFFLRFPVLEKFSLSTLRKFVQLRVTRLDLGKRLFLTE